MHKLRLFDKADLMIFNETVLGVFLEVFLEVLSDFDLFALRFDLRQAYLLDLFESHLEKQLCITDVFL